MIDRQWWVLSPLGWDRCNQTLVSFSILAFLPLQLPQILRNAQVLGTGDPLQIQQLEVIPLLGYGSGMLANLLLMSYLAERRETGGTIVQALGVLTSGIVVSQLFFGGFVHPIVMGTIALITGLGLLCNGARLVWSWQFSAPEELGDLGLSGLGTGGDDRWWQLWRNALNVLGLSVLPWILITQLHLSLWPSLPLNLGVTLSLGLFFLSSVVVIQTKPNPQPSLALASPWPNLHPIHWLRQRWPSLSGWIANFLFMVGPTAQVLNNWSHPESIGALALPTQGLAVLGNLLMLSRSGSLLIQGRDRIWAVGSLWEVAMRGIVFLTIAYFGFMPWSWFLAYGVGVLLYFAWIYANAQQNDPERSWFNTFRFLITGRSFLTPL